MDPRNTSPDKLMDKAKWPPHCGPNRRHQTVKSAEPNMDRRRDDRHIVQQTARKSAATSRAEPFRYVHAWLEHVGDVNHHRKWCKAPRPP